MPKDVAAQAAFPRDNSYLTDAGAGYHNRCLALERVGQETYRFPPK